MVQIAYTLLSLAALTSAAAITTSGKNQYTAPYGKGTFQLEALTNDGYSGTWLEPYHTGAGTNVAILTQNQTLAPAFKFNAKRGDVFYLGGSPPPGFPFSIALTNTTDYMGNTPKDYYVVTVSAGEPHQGLAFAPEDRNILIGPVGMGEFQTFAACLSNASVFYGAFQEQLFWRPTGSKAAKGCTDVQLKAVFNH